MQRLGLCKVTWVKLVSAGMCVCWRYRFFCRLRQVGLKPKNLPAAHANREGTNMIREHAITGKDVGVSAQWLIHNLRGLMIRTVHAPVIAQGNEMSENLL